MNLSCYITYDRDTFVKVRYMQIKKDNFDNNLDKVGLAREERNLLRRTVKA